MWGRLGDVSSVCVTFEFDAKSLLRKVERATRLEPATFSLGIKTSGPLFSHLQNCSGKISVHAVPDLRLAGGRLGDGFYHA